LTEQLVVGRTHIIERLVTPEVTADRYGNPGVAVFATPALIGLLEETAIGCIAPTLTEGQASVGTRVDVQHLAATPVGLKVTAHAELIEVDGRRLVFKVEARDERESIATGTHERFIVNSMQKFLARAQEKIK
jgi:fluoroacetyl-CoA thioesterase